MCNATNYDSSPTLTVMRPMTGPISPSSFTRRGFVSRNATDAIRVRIPQAKPAPEPKPAPKPAPATDASNQLNDDIPW